MYFAFIDESGTKSQNDKDNLVYTYCALLTQEHHWKFLHNETVKLKQKIWQMVKEADDDDNPPDDFKLHMKDITGRRKHFEPIKDDESLFLAICNQLYGLISRLWGKIICLIIIKEEFYKEYEKGLDKWAFELLVERVNRFVIEREECALLVIDPVDSETDKERRKEIEVFMKKGTGHGWEEYPENVIETPFIVKSNIHSGVQLVDAIAFLIRWHTRKCLGINPGAFFNKHCDGFMKLIMDRFYGNRYGEAFQPVNDNGIKFFPTSTQIPSTFWDIFYEKYK